MSYKLGLTGSIGMGKTTTARMFADEGCALWDADSAVHRLYAEGSAAVAPMQKAFPTAIKDGAVSRIALRTIVMNDDTALQKIESIVHPLVAADRAAFVQQADAYIIVFDIPLLYEMGGDREMDGVVVAYTSEQNQEARVMARGTLTPDQYRILKAKQMPSAEKRARADFTVHTDTMDHARAQVRDIVTKIRNQTTDA